MLRSMVHVSVVIGTCIAGIGGWAEDIPESGKVEAYRTWLDQLPKDEAVSVSQAAGRYLVDFPGCSEFVRIEAFMAFMDFQDAVSSVISTAWRDTCRRLTQTDKETKAVDWWMSSDNTVALTERCGLAVRKVYGRFIGVCMPVNYLQTLFGPHLSEAARRYLTLRAKDLGEDLIADGLLLIPPEEVMRRLSSWENYLQEYPDSPFKEDARILRNQYLRFFLLGTNESPVNPLETRVLFRRFANKHEETESAKRIVAYIGYLKEAHWQQPEPDDLYLTQLLRDLPAPVSTETTLQLCYRLSSSVEASVPAPAS